MSVDTGRTPVTLLSGFLGAGKTTLVNQVLSGSRGNIAVVVNEFGELSVDAALIGQSAGMIELNNGCVCCASRGDLPGAIAELQRLDRDFSHILVEASGLVDPGPVIQDLVTPPLAENLNFFGTVTVVDTANYEANLDMAEAAFDQFTSADLLLLNKVDLVPTEDVDLIESRLRSLNAVAPTVRTVRGALDADLLLNDWTDVPPNAALDAQRAGDAEHGGAGHEGHGHGSHHFSAMSLRLRTPVDCQVVQDWLAQLPTTIVRAKGVIRLPDGDVRAVHRVGSIVGAESVLRPEAVNDDGILVVIGSRLDAVTLPDWAEASAPR